MGYEPYFKSIDFSDKIKGFPSFSMTDFTSSYSYMPSFMPSGNIWTPSYSSLNLSSYSGGFFGSYGAGQTSAKAYDFSFLGKSSTPSVSYDKGKKSTSRTPAAYSGKTVTPGYSGKLKRPKSFATAEARKRWDLFAPKAESFNPKTDLGPEFLAKVKQISGEIGCEYRDLLALMQIESGLNPYIPNLAGYSAYGLIQFQPATLNGMGYQPEDLLTMSPVDQLDLVKKHLITTKNAKGLNGKLSAGQLYGLILAPAYVNNSYFYKAGSDEYNANANLDKTYGDNNGKIEKSDLAACIDANRVNENIFVA